MANKITLKRSVVPGRVPAVEDLSFGELAINYADGVLYYKNSGGGISSIDGTGVPVTISSTAPTGASEGDLWWDSESGFLFVYYNDGDSSQWVEASPEVLAEGPNGTYTLTGNLIVTEDITVQGTLFETSDRGLKNNIHTINHPLDTINRLRGVEFNWIKNDKQSMGLIAQEVEQVLPYLVQTDSTGTKTINYTALVGALIESIKELDDKVSKLQKNTIWDKIKRLLCK